MILKFPPAVPLPRFALAGAIVLGLAALLLSAGAAASGGERADAKIDSALAEIRLVPRDANRRKRAGSEQARTELRFAPIFVRMSDQLIGQAGEYEKFCQEHQQQKRSELRPWALKTLRQKSDKSWKQIARDVDRLVKDGQVKNVQRFWIVNGFSCIATQKAIQQLAACQGAAFVYLDHDPSPAAAAAPLDKAQKEIFQQVLQEWKDDSDEPLSTDGLEIPWNLRLIQADAAWEEEKVTGRGVVVAVCDSGLMRTPSLVRALWKNPKKELGQADEDGSGYSDDLFGYDFENNSPFVLYDVDLPHGSMCAGIIAGRPLNSKRLITGVAPRSRVMVLRGDGLLKMYEYALTHGADVLSMSYGVAPAQTLGNYRGLVRTAFEQLTAAGIVATGGVGNHGKDLPRPQQIVSPKDIPCVLGTAGILENGKHPLASSEGPCYWEKVKFYSDYPQGKPLRKPDLTAPFGGFPVWGRPGQGKIVAKPEHSAVGEQFTEIQALVTGPQGNSFSCPHTAGVAALVLSANPELNPWEVKQIMERTCKDLGDKDAYGAGLLQALDAVRAAKKVKK